MKDSYLNIAVRAARAAGNIITRAIDRLDTVKVFEKKPNDFATEVDSLSEQKIISILKKAYPEHSILAEESGETPGNEYQWIIDPLDGTRNFMHGFPQFAVSIAMLYRGRIEVGVVYDPMRQELFTATRGRGAHLNERRIRVSKRAQLSECLLGTGFLFWTSKEHRAAYTNTLNAILPECGDVRRAGAAALDLAYVAAGRLDGFWEMGLHSWDIAAGALLIKEAGGMIGDLDGTENYLENGNVVAGNPKTFKLLLQKLRPVLKDLF